MIHEDSLRESSTNNTNEHEFFVSLRVDSCNPWTVFFEFLVDSQSLDIPLIAPKIPDSLRRTLLGPWIVLRKN